MRNGIVLNGDDLNSNGRTLQTKVRHGLCDVSNSNGKAMRNDKLHGQGEVGQRSV